MSFDVRILGSEVGRMAPDFSWTSARLGAPEDLEKLATATDPRSLRNFRPSHQHGRLRCIGVQGCHTCCQACCRRGEVEDPRLENLSEGQACFHAKSSEC